MTSQPAAQEATSEQTLQLVRLLARGVDLDDAAAHAGIRADDAQALATQHGWPHADRLGYAVDELERQARLHRSQPTPPPTALPARTSSAAAPVPALRPLRTLPVAARRLQDVPLARLTPDPANPRRRLGDVGELAASMAQVGLLQPIVARQDGPRLVVVAGHRRLAAAQHLGWTTVPVVIRAHDLDDDALVAMLVENGQRVNLDPIEEARAYRRLMQRTGCTQADVATRVGKSQTHVSHRLTLLALPVAEQEKVRTRELRVADAIEAGRQAKGTDTQTRFTGWHLGKTHPLADAVRDACRAADHGLDRRVGGIGCGRCWEDAIRADERAQHREEAQA